ncbi:hypothetical protein [Arcanobacterium bovis]|uniref:Uncharacterized protein n=1 Tax=Arcanobacterium bovis TaxID=2529275 RepID=A0A4Q9V0S3_9ACTO|nr:hypothetical protein [Arcanobacterium bovis]TBW21085.1 hypothetical protein EZJ44_07210 [Arcanobacterium bovis]
MKNLVTIYSAGVFIFEFAIMWLIISYARDQWLNFRDGKTWLFALLAAVVFTAVSTYAYAKDSDSPRGPEKPTK